MRPVKEIITKRTAPLKLTIDQKADKETIPEMYEGYTCKYISTKGWTYNKIRVSKKTTTPEVREPLREPIEENVIDNLIKKLGELELRILKMEK